MHTHVGHDYAKKFVYIRQSLKFHLILFFTAATSDCAWFICDSPNELYNNSEVIVQIYICHEEKCYL